MRAEVHPHQAERLNALKSYRILDTERERRFDSIVELVAELFDAPIAVINLIDEHRQWFKAEVGLGVRETPLETSICSHAILEPGLTIIPDTLVDARMRDNPLCQGDPHLRFYAGALLETENGLPLGTLCVLDHKPRTLSGVQQRLLSLLAEQVMTQMRLTREAETAKALLIEVDHRVKNSLSLVTALLSLQARQADEPALVEALERARDRVIAIANVHDLLHATGSVTDVDLAVFVERLVDSLSATAPGGITVKSAVPSVMIGASQVVTLGIILNELVTNALRHAFNNHKPGTVEVTGAIDGEYITLTVKDTGIGLPPAFDAAKGKGLGMRLTKTLAGQIGNGLVWSSDSGAMFAFDFRLAPTIGSADAASRD